MQSFDFLLGGHFAADSPAFRGKSANSHTVDEDSVGSSLDFRCGVNLPNPPRLVLELLFLLCRVCV
jgi:hypothetical protein